MRKIESQTDIEKKEKRRKYAISIFMLVVMVASTLGYAFMGSEEDSFSNEGNGDERVIDTGSQWAVKVGNSYVYLSFGNEAVKNISVSGIYNLGMFQSKPLYISSDNQGAVNEISGSIGLYASRAQEACYGKCEKNLPEKNCNDTLIVFTESSENKVYQKDNCIFIDGDLRAVDAFLYKVFEIN